MPTALNSHCLFLSLLQPFQIHITLTKLRSKGFPFHAASADIVIFLFLATVSFRPVVITPHLWKSLIHRQPHSSKFNIDFLFFITFPGIQYLQSSVPATIPKWLLPKIWIIPCEIVINNLLLLCLFDLIDQTILVQRGRIEQIQFHLAYELTPR